ncbi:hypothetical protein [Bacillus thuringiensis]|uniref:Uncharacterized protein n=1 Tax=Bacillus thuringiensis TaxID=1428 RepID=A0A9X6WIQ7_BACTU|nr:hypothetical protein [Bacillus thuringiensis]PFJ31888.1 hypothetical protein COJ15_29755 [Bacillus thuringiensis]
MSKKVLFGLDNMLIDSYRNRNGEVVIEPRPGVLELLDKLRELKKQKEVEYVLFTGLPKRWVKTEVDVLGAQNFFDNIVSNETYLAIKPGSIEDKVFGIHSEFYGLKPFTVIEGDLLLIEDNPIMQRAGEAIKSEYEMKDLNRIIDICKVDFYESIDNRRYDIIDELEETQEKTAFNIKRIQKMRENLDTIMEKGMLEMEKIYDNIVQFASENFVPSQRVNKYLPVADKDDFESQLQRLIDLHF